MSNDDSDWLNAVENVKLLKKQEKVKHPIKPTRKTAKLTEEEVDDWDDFIYPEKKLTTEKQAQKQAKQNFQPEHALVNEHSQKSIKEQPFRIHSNISSKLSVSRASLDTKTMKRLSQGKVPTESKIDLHGFYLDDAWGALMDFINKSALNGLRCVLIVHGKGKGYGPKNDMGIIKSQINGWLLGHDKILAYHTATPRHGGNGALYVLLKRS